MESIFFFNLFIIEKRIDIFIYEFSLKTTTLLNMFLLDVNFDKSIIKLYFLLIFFMLAKFLIKLIINSYVINKLFKLKNFVI